jgi:hypothetical protein
MTKSERLTLECLEAWREATPEARQQALEYLRRAVAAPKKTFRHEESARQ